MFTGIIQEIGSVSAVRKAGGGIHVSVRAPETARELRVDESVSLNGVCQTVIRKRGSVFTVEAVEETLSKTTMGMLTVSSRLNLELPVRLHDRLGGHLVQGHVDCVGNIENVAKKASSWLITVRYPEEFDRYVIPVGSIAIDGISLTVAATTPGRLTVSIIPHTLEKTTLGSAKVNGKVNLEFDLVGKYIEKIMRLEGNAGEIKAALTEDRLKQWGY
jgi:riboflavin synthase